MVWNTFLLKYICNYVIKCVYIWKLFVIIMKIVISIEPCDYT